MFQNEFEVSHHLLLCATSSKGSCCSYEEGMATWKHLKKIIQKYDLDNPLRKEGVVLRSKVDCLRVCKQGPVLLIWPDGIWYGGVTAQRIDLIVREHIIRRTPLEKWIIRRTPTVNNFLIS